MDHLKDMTQIVFESFIFLNINRESRSKKTVNARLDRLKTERILIAVEADNEKSEAIN